MGEWAELCVSEWVSECVRVCACVCVCVWKRERERERDREGGGGEGREYSMRKWDQLTKNNNVLYHVCLFSIALFWVIHSANFE